MANATRARRLENSVVPCRTYRARPLASQDHVSVADRRSITVHRTDQAPFRTSSCFPFVSDIPPSVLQTVTDYSGVFHLSFLPSDFTASSSPSSTTRPPSCTRLQFTHFPSFWAQTSFCHRPVGLSLAPSSSPSFSSSPLYSTGPARSLVIISRLSP